MNVFNNQASSPLPHITKHTQKMVQILCAPPRIRFKKHFRQLTRKSWRKQYTPQRALRETLLSSESVPEAHDNTSTDYPTPKSKRAAYDKARRSTEEYKLQARLKARRKAECRRAEEALCPALAEERKSKAREKAAYDKARRSTEEYKLQARLKARRKAECRRAEEALCPALAEERKSKARERLSTYYQSNKEKIAARRSTAEMKAKKAAYDKARWEKKQSPLELLKMYNDD